MIPKTAGGQQLCSGALGSIHCLLEQGVVQEDEGAGKHSLTATEDSSVLKPLCPFSVSLLFFLLS